MITKIETIWQSQSWQNELANAICDGQQLLQLLELDESQLDLSTQAALQFPLRVPQSYIDKMQKGNPNDPLLRQIIPLGSELINDPNYSDDPLAEAERNPVPGIIHKYHGRVLLITSGACAVNCRYCFRRHFPYQENNPSLTQWQQSLTYVAERTDIEEVILSGGDPLAANDKYLSKLTSLIADIPHVKRLRIHSRLPLVIPQRINESCLKWLDTQRFDISLVIHANHPNELDQHTYRAFQLLRSHGVTLLNQSVLLASINDKADTLIELSKKLFSQGVLPYYVHALDKVAGAVNFDVDRATASSLQKALQEKLPGYLVPKFVYTKPGATGKTPL